MLSNRIAMADLRGKDAAQAADIPPDQLALLHEEARSTLDMAKKALDWIETVIALRYEQRAIAARGAAGKRQRHEERPSQARHAGRAAAGGAVARSSEG